MLAISLCAAFLGAFFNFPDGTDALLISMPFEVSAGPVRINFTKEATDPAGAYFNIVVPENGTRLADNVDLSAGFVDVNIQMLPGTYEIEAFGNDTNGPGFLGGSADFVLTATPTPTSAAASSTSSAATQAATSGTSVTVETLLPPSNSATPIAGKAYHSPTTLIVGIVITALAVLAILLLLLLFLRRRKQRAQRRDTLEAPDPMLQSSPSLTSAPRTYPSIQVDPFTSPLSSRSEMSLGSPQQRQQYITNEMRLVRKQMEELRRSGDASSVQGSSETKSPVFAPSQPSTADNDLERSRLQNDALQSRIAELEAQLQSAWALGLSNDPPPGYVA